MVLTLPNSAKRVLKLKAALSSAKYIEVLCFSDQQTNGATRAVTELLLNSIPHEILEQTYQLPEGSRWPQRRMEFHEFKRRFQSRPDSLAAWASSSEQRVLKITVSFPSVPVTSLHVQCDHETWNLIGGTKLVKELMDVAPFAYGHVHPMRPSKIFPIYDSLAVKTDSSEFDPYQLNRGDRWSVLQYEEMRGFWLGVSRKCKYRKSGIYQNPILVFEENYLSDEHLEQPVEEDQTLRQWIAAVDDRGTLDPLTDRLYRWSVPAADVERVVRDLWSKHFFWGSQYFEISGWLDELNVPYLRQTKVFTPLDR